MVLRILRSTKLYRSKKSGRVEAVNKLGTGDQGAHKVLLESEFIDLTMDTARNLQLETLTEFGKNKDTFLHLAAIAEKYKAGDTELAQIVELSKGDSQIATFYRQVLEQTLGKLVASGLLPGLKDHGDMTDIIVGMSSLWGKYVTSMFFTIAQCIRTCAVQKKFLSAAPL